MKRIYSNTNVALVWHVRNMLEQQGIPVQVRNDKLYSVAGELPVTECMAEVWVQHPLNYRFAEQLVAELESAEPDAVADWQCNECGESVAGSFAICWNCQSGTDPQSDNLL